MTSIQGGDEAADTSRTSTPSLRPSIQSPETLASNPLQSEMSSFRDNHTPVILQHDDDASDVSMSADTDDEDDQDLESSIQPTSAQIVATSSIAELPDQLVNKSDRSKKRKFPGNLGESDEGQNLEAEAPSTIKRVKIEPIQDTALRTYYSPNGTLPLDKSLLPAEIWHHIFTFTPPKSLGRLLQVNKLFRSYLDHSSSTNLSSLAPLTTSVVVLRQAESIWQASRRLYRPWMPTPLGGLTEIEMWRLSCSLTCQFCSKTSSSTPNPPDSWRIGPGQDGVRLIWAFAIRSCGSCLQQRTVKEIDLLLSSSVPSPLMTALPFIFMTSDLHVITATALAQGQPPAYLQIGKYFFNTQIEEIKKEFFRVKGMGSGAVEEWLKGLEDLGKTKRDDIARWERFDLGGGLRRLRENEPAEIRPLITKDKAQNSSGQANASNGAQFLQTNGLSRIPVMNNEQFQTGVVAVPPVDVPSGSYVVPARFNSPVQNGPVTFPSRTFQGPRSERTKEEVAELKAARRAEIERRCMQLDPPLLPGVLVHMGSFQAAIQIITPFDDNAWDLLKPRLLSQRAEAEQRENDRISQAKLLQERSEENRSQDLLLKEAKEVVDKEWEDVQAPLRARIGGYADEIMRDGWGNGEKVDKDSSPKFAAEVLIYVRKRFYAEIAKDEASTRAAGLSPKVDPVDGPFSKRLTLENMKWVFDMKIKPHTEQHRKELFLCNGCENNFKFYALEGVIQHYAAKHTSTLSVGSVVVHWRAEWPEQPPFNPDPNNIKSMYYTAPGPNGPFTPGTSTLIQNYGFGGYPNVTGSAPVPVPAQPPHYQPSPGPYYGNPHFGEQFPRTQTGSYAPPAPPFQGQPGYNGPQYPSQPVNAYQSYPTYPPQGSDPQYQNPGSMQYDPSQSNQIYPVSVPEQVGPAFSHLAAYLPGLQTQRPTGPRHTEAYQSQLQDIARFARDVWNNTSGIKEMPGSVRVFVILYHLLQRSRGKYQQDPPLSMLIDGLSNNKDMRVVRNVNGLSCKACALDQSSGGVRTNPKGDGVDEKKLFSLPQLFNHFQTTHVGNFPTSWNGLGPAPEWDWTTDMIQLPPKARIAELAEAPGIDEHKLQLIKEALPDAFRPSLPEPEAETAEPTKPYTVQTHVYSDHTYGHLAPSRDNHDKYYSMPARERSPVEPRSDRPRYESRNKDRFEEYVPLPPDPSNRIHREERLLGYADQPPLAYIDRRIPSPLLHERSVDEYGRQMISEGGRLPSQRSRQYLSDDMIPHPRARSPILIRYEDAASNRIEPTYAREKSLPRRLAAMDHPPFVDRIDSSHMVQRPNPQLEATVRPDSLAGHIPRSRQDSRLGTVEAGSEDGEVKSDPVPKTEAVAEAENAAERFLNDFLRDNGTPTAQGIERRDEASLRAAWETERSEGSRRIYDKPPEPQQIIGSASQGHPVNSVRSTTTDRSPPHVPRQRQILAYDYDDRYLTNAREPLPGRARSPHVIDHRYASSNAMYREERLGRPDQANHLEAVGRYDNPRDEKDRGRSRSPVYVKLGGHGPSYRDLSPGSRYMPQEPLYLSRNSQGHLEERTYERVPRPEYYRVYADEPRLRHSHHEPQVEYVQVSDPQGDYVIRRPVRREPEPMITSYQDEPAPRATFVETRAPLSRSDPAYYEEYDPRHPAPPPQTTIRQVRYQ